MNPASLFQLEEGFFLRSLLLAPWFMSSVWPVWSKRLIFSSKSVFESSVCQLSELSPRVATPWSSAPCNKSSSWFSLLMNGSRSDVRSEHGQNKWPNAMKKNTIKIRWRTKLRFPWRVTIMLHIQRINMGLQFSFELHLGRLYNFWPNRLRERNNMGMFPNLWPNNLRERPLMFPNLWPNNPTREHWNQLYL